MESPATLVVPEHSSFQYVLPDAQTNYWTLAVSNAWFEVRGAAASVRIQGLTLHNAVFRFDRLSQGSEMVSALASFDLTGDVTLTGSTSRGYLCPQTYQLDDIMIATNNSLFAMGDVTATNAVSGGTATKRHGVGCAIYCRNATVHGTLSASEYGFRGQNAPERLCHGGRGSTAGYTPYGSLTRPTALGSGNWRWVGSGPSGGGAIKVVVSDTLAVYGAITASGAPFIIDMYSGAGGSVWVVARTLTGNGAIRADAGLFNSVGSGGGRVAIDAVHDTFSGPVTVTRGGAGSYTGTVFRCQSVVFGSSTPDSVGPALHTTFSNSGNDVAITRTVTKWGNTLEWTDASARCGGAALNNTAAYTLTGLPASRYAVSTNGVHMLSATAAAGSLTLSAIPLNPSVIVRLDGPSGTVMLLR